MPPTRDTELYVVACARPEPVNVKLTDPVTGKLLTITISIVAPFNVMALTILVDCFDVVTIKDRIIPIELGMRAATILSDTQVVDSDAVPASLVASLYAFLPRPVPMRVKLLAPVEA